MFAVIINTIAIVIGTSLGLIFKKGIPERVSDIMMKVMGLCVVIIGLQGCIQEKNALILILSCVAGAAVGELCDLDGRISRGTERLTKCFERKETEDGRITAAEAFINSCLIMSVGAMMIVGSLDAGLKGNYTMLYTKSLLDLITGVMLGATMGAGVYGSALFTLIAQGAIVLLSSSLAPFLSDALILELSCSGSLMIVAIGTNMLELTSLKVINLLPAFLAVPFALQLMQALGLY